MLYFMKIDKFQDFGESESMRLFEFAEVVDYSKYTSTLNSAPFYVWILANALYLIIPAIILFAVGAIIKKNQ